MAHGFNYVHESLKNATGHCHVCSHAIYWSARFMAWMHDPKAPIASAHTIVVR